MARFVKQPFRVKRHAVCIEGGWLNEPWVVEAKKIKPDHDSGPIDFVQLFHSDRKLARALGLDCSGRAPFQHTTLFRHLARLRNQLVDRHIFADVAGNDPMADAKDLESSSLIEKDRVQMFKDAQVPEIVTVDVGDRFFWFRRELCEVPLSPPHCL